jgi:predicted Zn-dependent protease
MITRIRFAIVATVILTLVRTVDAIAQSDNSTILKAMQDEIARNMSDLVMENLERPYYIAYTIDDYQNLTIDGSLGTLTRSDRDRSRFLTVELRVGNEALDNTNFVAGFFDFQQNYFPITFENDYDAIRNQIYLATDKLYKSALKNLSKKRAYLQTTLIENRPDDFILPPANELVDSTEAFDLSQAYLEPLIRAASEVFRDYPKIISSNISLIAGVNNQYMVASNGTRAVRGDRLYTIELEMSGKGKDGEDIGDADRIIVNTLIDFPNKATLVNWAKRNAERMDSLLAAETMEEYTGPVIFTGDAAGELFRQLFAKNVSDCPAPLYEKEQLAMRNPGPALANKVKRRILPEFIDIYDDPTIDRLGNMKLLGCYQVDDAGEVPRRVQLVENGKLVGLLIGESPTKYIKESNGHARGAVSKDVSARPANMIVESKDKVPFDSLKRSLLEMCQDMGLDYGLVIRKVDDPNGTSAQMGLSMGNPGGGSALSSPLEAYRVYPNGHEEPLRNLEFSNVTVRILKDIMQTGDDRYFYNYLIGDDYEMPVTLVCPSVLVEEMELKKSEAKIKKPPVLPSPLAKGR